MIQYKVEYWSDVDYEIVSEVGLCEGTNLEEASRAIQRYYGNNIESVQFFLSESDEDSCWPLSEDKFDKKIWDTMKTELA